MKRILTPIAATLALALCAPVTAETVRASLPFDGESITLDLGYPQDVVIETWDLDEIEVEADVDLEDRSGHRDDAFQWRLDRRNGTAKVVADFGDAVANTIVTRDGADLSDGLDGDTLVTGTRLTIRVPQGVDLDVDSHSGRYHVSHNGGALLLNTVGDVTVVLQAGQGASVSANTIMGRISADRSLDVGKAEGAALSDEFFILPRQSLFAIAGGGPEISIVTLAGSIAFETAGE